MQKVRLKNRRMDTKNIKRDLISYIVSYLDVKELMTIQKTSRLMRKSCLAQESFMNFVKEYSDLKELIKQNNFSFNQILQSKDNLLQVQSKLSRNLTYLPEILIKEFQNAFGGDSSLFLANCKMPISKENSNTDLLCNMMKKISCLKHFGFDNCKVKDDIFRRIINVLDYRIIHTLFLERNRINLFDINSISSLLTRKSTLKKLSLNDNESIKDKGIVTLCSYLKNNQNLNELNLRMTGFESQGLRELADLLKTNTSIKEIDISCNNFPPESIKYLSEAVKINKDLNVLKINNNNLNDEGFIMLCEGLNTNEGISSLEVGSNLISDTGFYHFSGLLKKNKHLDFIILKSNKIKDQGLHDFLDMIIKQNVSLRMIDLDRNEILDKESFKHAIKNSNIEFRL